MTQAGPLFRLDPGVFCFGLVSLPVAPPNSTPGRLQRLAGNIEGGITDLRSPPRPLCFATERTSIYTHGTYLHTYEVCVVAFSANTANEKHDTSSLRLLRPVLLPAALLQVRGMLSLATSLPGTRIRIFSGLQPGGVKRALLLAAAEEAAEPAPGVVVRGVGSSGSGSGSGAPKAGLGTVIVATATTAAAETVGS